MSKSKKPYQMSVYVPSKGYKKTNMESVPHVFLDLDGVAMDTQTYPTLCTACVKFPDRRTAVVHFSVHVNGSKVVAIVAAGGKTREVRKSVCVPAWNRKFL